MPFSGHHLPTRAARMVISVLALSFTERGVLLNLASFPPCVCDSCLWLLFFICSASWLRGIHTANRAQFVHSAVDGVGHFPVWAVMTIAAQSRSVRMFNEHTDACLLVRCPGWELLGQSRPRTSLRGWGDYCRRKVWAGSLAWPELQDREVMGVSRGGGRRIPWWGVVYTASDLVA